MADPNIHHFVKQYDGSILCSWSGCQKGDAGCRPPSTAMIEDRAGSSSASQLILTKLTQLQQQHEELSIRLPSIQEDVQTSAAIIRYIPDLLSSLAHGTFNPYTESVISTERDLKFRKDVIAFYYRAPANSDTTKPFRLPVPSSTSSSSSSAAPAEMRTVKHGRKIACMMSGQLGNNVQVIAAHIHPHSSPINTLNYAGLTRAEVMSTRNGLLLAVGIEDAFDRLDVSFVPLLPTRPDMYVLKIWTPPDLPASGTSGKKGFHLGDVRPLPLWQNQKSPKTIGNYEGCQLFYGNPVDPPLKRALSYQAWLAYDRAIKQGWLNVAVDPPPDFGTPNDSPFQRQRRLSSSTQQEEE